MVVGVVVVALGGVLVVRLHCGGGLGGVRGTIGLILVPLMHTCIFVYQMGRLCGGTHEISGISAPFCLHGWVVGGFMGWVGVGVCGDGMGGVLVVLWGVGGWWGGCCVCGGGGKVSSVCGGVGAVFVVVGCTSEEWGGWVVVCWVDLYNPYMVPHTIP